MSSGGDKDDNNLTQEPFASMQFVIDILPVELKTQYMSNAKCPNCGSGTFACDLINVKNIDVPVGIIYCTSCYAAIGSFDPVIHNKIDELTRKNKLGILEPILEE